MTYTSADLIAQYLKIRDMKAMMEERHKAELAPLKNGLATIENALLASMHEDKITQIKCEAGTAFQKSWTSVKTVDRDALFRFVIGGERYDLLTAAVSKDVVREIIDESGSPPPGVDVTTGIEVQVRKAS